MLPICHIETIPVANNLPFILIAGVNVLESKEIAFQVCKELKDITDKLNIPFIFKASFDKANRTSVDSYRGLPFEESMNIFRELRQKYKLPILTDIHEPYQAKQVSEYVDVLQIPAFLARQTDLLKAACQTGKPLHIKKPQFMAPDQVKYIVEKCQYYENPNIMICERGTQFGYNNLVVDMLGISEMKYYAPVIFDASHSLQRRDTFQEESGGRSQYIFELTRSAISVKIAGLFLEVHPDPKNAKCDGPCALQLDRVEEFLFQMKEIDTLVKNF